MAQKGASAGLSLAGKGFFGSLCAGTFSLGVWQTQRYFEKQDMIKEREDALSKEPLTQFTFDKSDFQIMRLQGRYLYDKELLVGPRSPSLGSLPDKPGSSGQGMARAPMGYFVLTPFQISQSHVLIVNRGWIPRTLVYDERRPNQYVVPEWDRPKGNVSVTAISSTPEKPKIVVPEHKLGGALPELFWMDLDTMKEHVTSDADSDLTVLAMVTAVREEEDKPATSFPASPPVKTIAEFKTSPAIHAGYAATWYGLAAAGVFMTRLLILRK